MVIKNLMDKFRGADDYVELEHEEEQRNRGPLVVQVEKLDSYNDSDRIQRKVREGTMMLVKIRDLKSRDVEELKRSVERIRRTCLAVNGDIAGLGDDWLIVTPSSAKVHRETEEATEAE